MAQIRVESVGENDYFDRVFFDKKGRVYMMMTENTVRVFKDGTLLDTAMPDLEFHYSESNTDIEEDDEDGHLKNSKMFLTEDERYLCLIDDNLRAIEIGNLQAQMKVVKGVYLGTPVNKSVVLVAKKTGYHDVVEVDLSTMDLSVENKESFQNLQVTLNQTVDIFFHVYSRRFYEIGKDAIKMTVIGGPSKTFLFGQGGGERRRYGFTATGKIIFMNSAGLFQCDENLKFSLSMFHAIPFNYNNKFRVDLVEGGEYFAGFFGTNALEVRSRENINQRVDVSTFGLDNYQIPLQVKVSPDLKYVLITCFNRSTRQKIIRTAELRFNQPLSFAVSTAIYKDEQQHVYVATLYSNGSLKITDENIGADVGRLLQYEVSENTEYVNDRAVVQNISGSPLEEVLVIRNVHRVEANGRRDFVNHIVLFDPLTPSWNYAIALVKSIKKGQVYRSLSHFRQVCDNFNFMSISIIQNNSLVRDMAVVVRDYL